MKLKLALGLILTCAFCLQASARNNCDNDEDAPIARTASVPSVDLKSETPQPANVNAPSAGANDYSTDNAFLEAIARTRSMKNNNAIDSFYSGVWEESVEQVLKMADGTLDLTDEAVTNLNKECLFAYLSLAETTPELDKIFDLNLREYREQGLSEKEIRKKALESAQYFAEIINNNPIP